MRRVVWLFGLLVLGSAALAQDKPAAPEEVLTGEVRISLSSDYAKLRVDGEEWEEHAFTDNGRTLTIHSLRRTEEHKVTLTPLSSDLEAVELTIKPEDWKLVPIKKTEKVWRVERKVVFQKKAAQPAAAKPTK